MNTAALRKIEQDLLTLAAEDEPVDPQAVRLAAMRVGAQAEMIEKDIAS